MASYELTSWMFAVEASAVNAYFLYLASKFRKNRTNANARKVFLTSLWYLPVVLFALAMHQRQKNSQKNTEELSTGHTVVYNADGTVTIVDGAEAGAGGEEKLRQTHEELRQKGKGYCPHEILNFKEVISEDDTGRWLFQKLLQISPPFCAKMYAESLMKSAAAELVNGVGKSTATVGRGAAVGDVGGVHVSGSGEISSN